MQYTDFNVEAVLAGQPLTADERAFLIRDTPHFEEGMHLTSESLSSMTDPELMRTAYDVWADYASGQV